MLEHIENKAQHADHQSTDNKPTWQVVWTNEVDEKPYVAPMDPMQGAVLMLGWAPCEAVRGTNAEVLRLGSLFEEKFQFIVERKQIFPEHDVRPASQAFRIVSEFIGNYEGVCSPLIIYYDGIGSPRDYYGDLKSYNG